MDELRTRPARTGRRRPVDPASDRRRVARRSSSGTCRRLRPVINATGVLLHTGLGRAPLAARRSRRWRRSPRATATWSSISTTERAGGGPPGIAGLLRELTGAEAATVVNNNAGATVLALRALAAGREVIVSRGQLVEIGGSFRLPEIFEVSGARLREVGTTNKTRLSDYARAIGAETAAILRVHPQQLPDRRIHRGARARRARRSWPMPTDSGRSTTSAPGRSRPGCPPGVDDEPTAAEGLAAGADLVLFSGDKLLGGPQCGIMVGQPGGDRAYRGRPADAGLAGRQDDARRARGDAAAGARTPGMPSSASRSGAMIAAPLADLMARAESLAAVLPSRARPERLGAWRRRHIIGGGSAPIHADRVGGRRRRPAVSDPRARGIRGGLGRGAPARRSAGRRPGPGRERAPRPADRGRDEEPQLLDAIRRVCQDREHPATRARRDRTAGVRGGRGGGWRRVGQAEGPGLSRGASRCVSADSVSTRWS